MAINFGDIASFATGVVKADEAATQERLKDRRAELAADKQFYIDLKTKKYESELKTFEEENKKYKSIQAVNAKAKSGMFNDDEGKINPSAYGQAYLQETNPALLLQFKEAYKNNPSELNTILASYSGDSISKFKTSTTEEALSSKLKSDVDAINADYKTQLENARGDSKLINAIIGKRDKEVADTIQKNENSKNGVIKAKEIAVETSTEAEPNLEFGEVKQSTSIFIDKDSAAYKNFRTNNKEFASALQKANGNKNSADNQLTIAQSFRQLGIANVGDYFETNNEGGIKSFKKGGENFADTMFSQWKMYKDYKINPGTDNLYLAFDKDESKLIKYYDKENANGFIANRTKDLAVPVASGNIAGEGGTLNFSNILRNKKDNLIVVPTANTIDFDGTVVGSDIKLTNSKDKTTAKLLYAKALINNSKVDGQINIALLKRNQDTLQNLQYGESNALLEKVNNDFINLYKGTTTAVDDGTPPPSNNNVSESIKVTFSDGKTLLLPNTEEVKADLEADKDNIISQEIQKNIKQEPTAGDASVAETSMGVNDNVFGNKIKPEAELGDVNPKFTTLESVLKILPNNMTGKEIKEKYNIDFKINEKSLFRPLK